MTGKNEGKGVNVELNKLWIKRDEWILNRKSLIIPKWTGDNGTSQFKHKREELTQKSKRMHIGQKTKEKLTV